MPSGRWQSRDVFSRMVIGAKHVMSIAPAATAIAFMVGITPGPPAGCFGGRFDADQPSIASRDRRSPEGP